MNIRTLILAGAAAFVALACCGAEMNRGRFGDVDVSLVPFQYDGLCHGYAFHEVRVANKSAQQTHEVVLKMVIAGGHSGYEGISGIERTVIVGPGAQVTVSMFQPPVQFPYNKMEVYVDGRRHEFDTSGMYRSFGYSYGHNAPRVLASRRINNDNIENHFNPTNTSRHGYSREEWSFLKSERDPGEWAGEWLAYSCFDGVVLMAADYRELNPEARGALLGYARCGGALVVMGEGAREVVGKDVTFGTTNTLAEARMGFGGVYAVEAAVPEKLTIDQTKALSNAWTEALGVCRRIDIEEGMRKMPVTDSLKVPVGMMTLIIIGFSVLVGPVNLLVLAKIKRRIWMLWTIPAIALATSALIWIHAFVSEGVTPTVKMAGVTILDQRSGIAASLGFEACYCPLTPGGGLRFAATTEVTPMWTRDNTTRSVDWTRDQHFKGGWVAARVPTYFMVRSCETRRERLRVFQAGDGTMRAINGLGAVVSNLYVTDAKGELYFAANVAAGAETALKKTTVTGAIGREPEDVLRSLARGYAVSSMFDGRLMREAVCGLRPSMYIAELGGAPFLDVMLEGKAHRSARSLVAGIYEPDAAQGGGNGK